MKQPPFVEHMKKNPGQFLTEADLTKKVDQLATIAGVSPAYWRATVKQRMAVPHTVWPKDEVSRVLKDVMAPKPIKPIAKKADLREDLWRPRKKRAETVFLGGKVSGPDGEWREEVKQDLRDAGHKPIDPKKPKWDPAKDIYKEVEQMLTADKVLFYKGGEFTRREKKLLDAVGKDYEVIKRPEEAVEKAAVLANPYRSFMAKLATAKWQKMLPHLGDEALERFGATYFTKIRNLPRDPSAAEIRQPALMKAYAQGEKGMFHKMLNPKRQPMMQDMREAMRDSHISHEIGKELTTEGRRNFYTKIHDGVWNTRGYFPKAGEEFEHTLLVHPKVLDKKLPFFHGTSPENAMGIERNGFKLPDLEQDARRSTAISQRMSSRHQERNHAFQKVFMTSDRELAKSYAMGREFDNDGVTFHTQFTGRQLKDMKARGMDGGGITNGNEIGFPTNLPPSIIQGKSIHRV